MNGPYETFIGKTYQLLLKDSAFLSLIGGNVPQVVDASLDRFTLTSESKSAELIFSKSSQVLRTIIFTESKSGCFPKLLTNRMNANDVYDILGKPIQSIGPRRLPVLGMVPPFDRFNGNIVVTFSLDSGLVQEVRFVS